MIARKSLPNPRCKRAPLPSNQMVIRRYRSIENQLELRTFFEQGLFSKQLTKFDDDNEGVVDNFKREGGLAGATAAVGGWKSRRRNENNGDKGVSDEEWIKGLKEYHENARKQHFANCWRLGTDEEEEIWKEYTRDDNMIQGCAIETTVGEFITSLPKIPIKPGYDESSPHDLSESPAWNLALTNQNCDIKVGACRYQKRWKENSYQPSGWPAAVSFFKGEEFDIENEFRLVFNPFSSNVSLEVDDKGIPRASTPDVTQRYRKFIAATKWMANKVIMAPNSQEREQEKVACWLDEFGMNVNTGSDADIELVKSSNCTSQHSTHEYLAELGGTANYEGSDQHLSDISVEFLEKRDWSNWPIVDIVFLLTEGAGGIVEGYWHQSDSSAFDISEYGHDFQRVWVARFRNEGEDRETWRNSKAEDFDEKQGRRTLSFSREE